jgi:hypothetical protein
MTANDGREDLSLTLLARKGQLPIPARKQITWNLTI